jgi:hypothetical protein
MSTADAGSEYPIAPIESLLYRDERPHAAADSPDTNNADGTMPDLYSRLEQGLAALSSLDSVPLAEPAHLRVMEVVPIDSLLYRGEAALARAREMRAVLADRGLHDEALDELFDLLDLASTH